MDLQFHINDSIPLDKIYDSMQLDSNQTIAHLKIDGYDITLEVKGHVRVVYKDQVYKHASDFPNELLQLFAEQKAGDCPDLFVDDNNWFEVFIEKDGVFMSSEVADFCGLDVPSIFSYLYETYEDFKAQK